MHISKRVWALTGTMFLAALAVSLVYMYMQLHALPEISKNALNPLIKATHPGSLVLETDSKTTTFAVNKEITLMLSGNSKEVPVGGYDAVITYDPSVLEFLGAKNEMGDFDFFTTQKTDQISLTASLKLTSKATPLTDAILATLRFKTKKVGTALLHFQYEPDVTTDSNLLSDKTKDILGSVDDLSVVVGSPLTINTTKPTEYNGKMITLLEASIPDPTCRDCQSLVRIAVEQQGKTDVLSYKNGGLVGLVEREKSIGNTVYRLEDASRTTALLIIGER